MLWPRRWRSGDDFVTPQPKVAQDRYPMNVAHGATRRRLRRPDDVVPRNFANSRFIRAGQDLACRDPLLRTLCLSDSTSPLSAARRPGSWLPIWAASSAASRHLCPSVPDMEARSMSHRRPAGRRGRTKIRTKISIFRRSFEPWSSSPARAPSKWPGRRPHQRRSRLRSASRGLLLEMRRIPKAIVVILGHPICMGAGGLRYSVRVHLEKLQFFKRL